MRRRPAYRRGYPVAVLIGLEESRAVVWRVFSNVVKLHVTVKLEGNRKDENALYNFYESIVNALRPALREGIKSVLLAAPMKTSFAEAFFDHVRKHHSWLVNSKGSSAATFGILVGSAGQLSEVADLVKTTSFRKLIDETTSEEADRAVKILEKRLDDVSCSGLVLYSVKEIEDLIYSPWGCGDRRAEYLMLTDAYLAESKEKNRIQRLVQVARNKNVKTMTVKAETNAGRRLTQFGGLVCLTQIANT